MFIAYNRVRMHDTDMAGILYFARMFRFAHDALEDFLDHEGVHFQDLFRKYDFVFVIAHAEADYKVPLTIGDDLEIHVSTPRIGTTSFSIHYEIFRKADQVLAGTAKTIHVTLNPETRQKIPIPERFKLLLEKHHGK